MNRNETLTVKSILALLISFFCFIYGSYLSYTAISQHSDIKNWPSTTAKILLFQPTITHRGSFRTLGLVTANEDYLKVEYTPFGETYTSGKIVWSGNVINILLGKSARQSLAEQCMSQRTINIYYSPSNPYEFVLDRNSLLIYPGRHWLLVFFTGLMLLSVVLMQIIVRQPKVREKINSTVYDIIVHQNLVIFMLLLAIVCLS